MGTCWLWYCVADEVIPSLGQALRVAEEGVPSLGQALRVTAEGVPSLDQALRVADEGVPSLGPQQLVRQSIPSLNVAHHLFIAPTT